MKEILKKEQFNAYFFFFTPPQPKWPCLNSYPGLVNPYTQAH